MTQARRSLLRCGGPLSILLLNAAATAGPDGPPRIVSIDPAPTGGADQLGVSAIHVGFDEAISVPAGAIALDGLDAGPLAVTSDFDFGTNVLTITLPATVTADLLTLVLDFTITDMTGEALDGEIFDPSTGSLPSGDGRAGGQAVFQFEVLQGDANRNGLVDSGDAQLVAEQLGLCAGDPGFDADVDLNGDGCVNVLDVNILQNGFGGARPVTDGQGPAITSRDPAPLASIRGFSFETVVVAFDEPADPARLDARSLFSSRPDGTPRAADAVAVDADGMAAMFTFDPPLEQGGPHRLQLSNAVSDASHALLDPAVARTWLFQLDQRAAHPVNVSPADGEGSVALTRETIIRFDHPIDGKLITGDALFATFAGEAIPALIHVNPESDQVTLFYEQPLPASAEVRVTIVGDLFVDDLGLPVDADFDGAPGGTTFIDFQTLTLTTLPGTRVCGRVFDSVLSEGGVNVPLEGVLVTVDGAADTLFAVTDASGDFCLDPAPVGRFFVHVDGRTAQNADTPEGAYYPNVGKPWTSIAGQEVNVGNVFLPLVIDGTLQEVSDVDDTTIEFPQAVIDANPGLAGVSITVPAGSLFANDGSTGGQVGIAPVDPARLPGQLPAGLEFPIVITVQSGPVAEGAMQPTNFDTPAPVVFPNLPDPVTQLAAPPGAVRALFSFDHDAGRWKAAGTMTISEDGQFAVSDPGSGILAPGWHATGPPPITPPPPPCDGSCCLGTPSGGAGASSDCNCDQAALSECQEICDTEVLLCLFNSVTRFFACTAKCEPGFFFTFEDCVQLCTGVREAIDSGCLVTAAECINFGCFASAGCGGTAGETTAGADADIFPQLAELSLQMAAMVYPFVISGSEVPEEVVDQFYDLRDVANDLAGGSALDWLMDSTLALESSMAELEAAVGEARGNAPPYAIHYLAEIPRDNGDILRLRGMTDPDGQYSIFVPSDGTVAHVLFYDQIENAWGHTDLRLTPNTTHRLKRLSVHPLNATEPDFDGDGLADLAELTLGTLTFNPDTDGDGIPDGAEVEQGTDPLDGLIVQTGIIATADTPGTAKDVCAINDLAIVADSSGGVSVFNVFNGMDPTIIAQVPTQDDVEAVSCTADGRFVGAITDDALLIIDMTDPPAAFIAHEVSSAHLIGNPRAIVAAGDTFYVGTDFGAVTVVHGATGSVLDHVVTGGSIHDLAVDGDVVYALRGAALDTIPMFGNPLSVLASVSVPGGPSSFAGRRRLAVGDGVAYAAWMQGVATVDVSNPVAPALIATNPTSQFGWKQVAINGSGDAVATVGPNANADPPHDVSLYDFSDPADTDVFITQFPTPSAARSVSIYNGLAYVADSQSGLHVVNYEPYDALGVPPSVSFATNVGGSEVVEGSLVLISVSVDDDVQVRNVELIVNDETVQTDGNFPFQFYLTAPLLAEPAGAESMTITVRASDTGGNTTLAPVQDFTVIPDTTSPTVIATNPGSGDTVPDALIETVGLSLRFSESLDPATVNGASVLVISAGRDGALDTADDVTVPASVDLVELDRRIAVIPDAVPIGPMRLFVDGSIVTDVAGNLVDGNADGTGGDDFALDFTASDSPFTKTWVTEASGNWNDPANWSGGTLPDITDIVLIQQPTLVTVTVSGGSFQVGSVHCTERMQFNSGGALTVLDTLQVDEELNMNGGTLAGATLLPSALDIPTHVLISTFSGVTIEGTVEVESELQIAGGVTINGTVDLQGGSMRTLSGVLVGGTGTIVGTGNSPKITASQGVSTLGPDLTVIEQANFNMDVDEFNGGSWILQGTLRAQSSMLRVIEEWTNEGLLSCEGGILQLGGGGSWSNAGTIALDSGTLRLSGSFTAADIGDLQPINGLVQIAGAMDNTGDTLLLDATTGSWELASSVGGHIGNIIGGVIDTADGSVLRVAGGGAGGRLTSTTVEGIVEAASALSIVGGVTINGTVEVQNTTMQALGSMLIGGTGTIIGTGNAPKLTARDDVSTLGPDITVIEQANFNMDVDEFNGGSWILQGTLRAQNSTLRVLDDWTNEGLLSCEGGILQLGGGGSWSNDGTIALDSGTLWLAGSFTTADIGDLQPINGLVQIAGTMDNTGDTLLLDAATGSWELASPAGGQNGNIIGGVIDTADGHVLRVAGGGAGGRLTSTTVDGFVEATSVLSISGGLTINGTVEVQNTTMRTLSGMLIDGTGTIIGTGNAPKLTASQGVSTLGPDLTVIEQANFNMDVDEFNGGSWILQGTLRAQNSTLRVVDDWTNEGLISGEGGILQLGGAGSWSNQGTIAVTSGILRLSGSFTTAGIGDLQQTGGIIQIAGAMDNTGDTLMLDATTGSWELASPVGGQTGNIIGGVIDTADGSVLRVTGTSRMTGPTIEGLVEVTSSLEIVSGLTINGTVDLQNGTLRTLSGVLVDGTGTIIGTGNSPNLTASGGISTLGPDLTVLAQATFNMDVDEFNGGSWILQGTLRAQTGELRVVDDWTNEGLLSCEGGTLQLGGFGSWSNSGTIALDSGVLRLSGSFTTAGIGDLQRSGGTVTVAGAMDNTGDTLLLDAATGSWELASPVGGQTGNIIGGVIDTADGSVLRVTGTATMTNAAVEGVVEVVSSLQIAGGVTINGTVDLQNGTLRTLSGVLVGGTGTIIGAGNVSSLTASQGVSTLGPDLTVVAGAVFQTTIDEFNGGAWINQAMITAESGLLRFGDAWTNEGTVVVTSSGEMNTAPVETTNGGVIRVAAGGTCVIHQLTQTRAGSIDLDVAGTSPSQYGSIGVTTTAALDGSLVLRFVDRFVPTAGNSFDAMTWSSFTGAFGIVESDGLPGGLALDPVYDATGLEVAVVRAAED